MSVIVCFKLLVFEPKTTVPPITTAIAAIRTVGSNPSAPMIIAEIKIPPAAMATFEIKMIFKHLSIISVSSSVWASMCKICSCRSPDPRPAATTIYPVEVLVSKWKQVSSVGRESFREKEDSFRFGHLPMAARYSLARWAHLRWTLGRNPRVEVPLRPLSCMRCPPPPDQARARCAGAPRR